MPSGYDEMRNAPIRLHRRHGGQRRRRDLLRAAMEAEGFVVNKYEWWHFDYKDWRRYPSATSPSHR